MKLAARPTYLRYAHLMFSRARLRLKRAPLLGEGGGFPLLEEEELEVLLRPTPTRRELTMRRGGWTCVAPRPPLSAPVRE